MSSQSGIRSERPPMTLKAGDLVLEHWRVDLVDGLHDAVVESIEHLRPFMAWASDARRGAQLSFVEGSRAAWNAGERFEYAILGSRGSVLGSVGLLGRIGAGGLEIGYWVHAAHTRRGIATLAAAALTRAAFELPSIDRVEIHHDLANAASARVPERLGFHVVGTFDRPAVAPAETGRDMHWRLEREGYGSSGCPALLRAASGVDVAVREPESTAVASTPDPHPNVELHLKVVQAVNARRVPDSVLAAGFTMENRVSSATDFEYHGEDGWREWMNDLFEHFGEDARYEVTEVIAVADDYLAAGYRVAGRGAFSDEPLEFRWWGVTWFRNARAQRSVGYGTRAEALDALDPDRAGGL